MEENVDWEKECNKYKNQLDLVAKILAAKEAENDASKYLHDYRKLLEDDYMKFARNETTFTADADARRTLREVADELENIASFPMLYTKNIVAVAGGFSSGKSKFLNTFFKTKDVQLSIGIKPVTAIPTYIVSGKNSSVVAFTPDGRQGEIPASIFSKIDHALIDELGFNLKSIMPYVTVATPFKDETDAYDNICFIDTPGYDPGSGGESDEDKGIAFDAVRDASALIWAVSVKDGTIHDKSIDFLNKILEEDPNKRLYVVCTKADLAKSQLQNVMSHISEILNDNGINFEGISAFSSQKEGEEFLFEENPTSVYDFIKKQNTVLIDVMKKCAKNTSKVDEVFDGYKNSINADLKKIKDGKEKIKALKIQVEKISDEKEKEIQELKKNSMSSFFQNYKNGKRFVEKDSEIDLDLDFEDFVEDKTAVHKKNLEEVSRICKFMKDCIYKIFEELLPENSFRCPKCNAKLEPDSAFCPICGIRFDSDFLMQNIRVSDSCSSCGSKLDSETVFCPKCGTRRG